MCRETSRRRSVERYISGRGHFYASRQAPVGRARFHCQSGAVGTAAEWRCPRKQLTLTVPVWLHIPPLHLLGRTRRNLLQARKETPGIKSSVPLASYRALIGAVFLLSMSLRKDHSVVNTKIVKKFLTSAERITWSFRSKRLGGPNPAYCRILGFAFELADARPAFEELYFAACGNSSGLDPPRNSRFPSLKVIFAPLAEFSPFFA